MKVFLVVALLLACVSTVNGQITVLGSETGVGGANGFTLGPFNTGSANFFAFVVSYQGSAPTVSDSVGNMWNSTTACGVGGNNPIKIYYSYNATPNASHSFTVSGASSVSSGVIFWASGVKSSGSPFDDESCGTYESSALKRGGQVLPTENGELIISGTSLDNGPSTVTVNSGFGNQETRLFSPGTHYGVSAASRVVQYVNTYNPQFVLDSGVFGVATTATFKAASPGGGSYTPQTRTLADCDDATLQSAHDNDAEYGDTLQSPSCTINNSISSTVVMYKAITWSGNGCTSGTVHGKTVNTSCNTTIKDALASNSPMLIWYCPSGLASRITGINFDGSARAMDWDTTSSGIISIDCNMDTGTTFRIDNNIFDHLQGNALGPNTVRGVADHNWVKIAGNNYFYYCFTGHYASASDSIGNTSWNSSVPWGSADFFYAEDNVAEYDAGGGFAGTDGTTGCRDVFRKNYIVRFEPERHGTDTGGNRGTRAIENYENTYDFDTVVAQGLQGLRSGSAIIWGNTSTSPTGTPVAGRLVYDRCCAYLTFGLADGENAWDNNDSANNPYNPGSPCTGGTSGKECTPSSSGSLTVTVSGANWNATGNGQWYGYTIHKTTGTCSPNCASIIVNNTIDTITFNSSDTHGDNLDFADNGRFEINKVLEGIDQPGRGGGSLLTGTDWTMMSVPGGWNDQVDFPVVEFLNTDDGASVHSGPGNTAGGLVRENEHFYNYVGSIQSNPTTPFNGTVGVGVGTIANRPTTCTAGVFYWATDEGEWDSTHGGVDGKMYRCTATDTWNARYGAGDGNTTGLPYTYPHPLTAGGGGGGGGAPVGVRILARP